MPNSFDSMYLCEASVTTDIITALLLKRRSSGTHHVAYRTVKMDRWKVSAPCGQAAWQATINILQRRMMRGEGFHYFIHEVRTHQRQTMQKRWIKHRKAMEMRRERAALMAVPTFGMF
jgi:hypothetical protein